MAAGSMTITEISHGSVKKIKAEWTAGTGDDVGAVSASTSKSYDGRIIAVATVPATGDDQPDDNYDVELLDADSVDVALGNLENRDETNREYVKEADLGAIKGTMTISVSGAGASHKGTVYVWLR